MTVPRTAAEATRTSDEKARRGRREVRLQLRPETARAIEARAHGRGRQAFSDAVNALLRQVDERER